MNFDLSQYFDTARDRVGTIYQKMAQDGKAVEKYAIKGYSIRVRNRENDPELFRLLIVGKDNKALRLDFGLRSLVKFAKDENGNDAPDLDHKGRVTWMRTVDQFCERIEAMIAEGEGKKAIEAMTVPKTFTVAPVTARFSGDPLASRADPFDNFEVLNPATEDEEPDDIAAMDEEFEEVTSG